MVRVPHSSSPSPSQYVPKNIPSALLGSVSTSSPKDSIGTDIQAMTACMRAMPKTAVARATAQSSLMPAIGGGGEVGLEVGRESLGLNLGRLGEVAAEKRRRVLREHRGCRMPRERVR